MGKPSPYAVLADVASTAEGMNALIMLYATGVASGITTAVHGHFTLPGATAEEITEAAMGYISNAYQDPVARNVMADLITNSIAGIESGVVWVPTTGVPE